MGTQSNPFVCATMNATLSGVANCAARIKSPSFSLDSSSNTTTNCPDAIAFAATSMEENSMTDSSLPGE
eukprot:m.24369 g.24369  ORF g.24369 m.24369 type:complete len:69 (-) comp14576_c0_seq1:267-473(-)